MSLVQWCHKAKELSIGIITHSGQEDKGSGLWMGRPKEKSGALRGVEDASCCTVYDDFRVPKWQMDIVFFNSAMISRAEDAFLNISGCYRTSFSAEVATSFVLAMRDIASPILWEGLSLFMTWTPDIYWKSLNSVSWQNTLFLQVNRK